MKPGRNNLKTGLLSKAHMKTKKSQKNECQNLLFIFFLLEQTDARL